MYRSLNVILYSSHRIHTQKECKGGGGVFFFYGVMSHNHLNCRSRYQMECVGKGGGKFLWQRSVLQSVLLC